MPALTSAPEGATSHDGQPAPGSLGAVGRGWLAALFLACAGYAAAVALLASSGVQHSWAVVAAPCYAAATLATAWPRRGRDLALLLSLGGGLAAPLGWLVAENRARNGEAFSRTTLRPAFIISMSTFGSSVAGPAVATILVRFRCLTATRGPRGLLGLFITRFQNGDRR